jgi:uncharacterized protein
LKIDIRDFKKNDNKHFDFIKEFLDFNIGEEKILFVDPVFLSINVIKNENEYIVNGVIKTIVKLRCSRCLEYFKFKIETDFTESFINEFFVNNNNEDLKEDDYLHLFSGNLIHLDNFVKQNIIFSIPVKKVCNDNCKGLCPNCGTNLNIKKCRCEIDNLDPRLAIIKDYYKK